MKPVKKKRAILGISAYYHDAAAALVVDGEIVAAAQEERFTRKKYDESFPLNAVRYVLAEYGLTPADLSAVAFYDKPLLKFERLLETYHRYAPTGFSSFFAAMPVWIKDKLFIRQHVRRALEDIEGASLSDLPILFPEHHLSHAASAFYPSPFEEAAILTVDGVGEWTTTLIGKGAGKDITVLKEMHFPHSIGILYSAFTYYCGFKINSGEYKLMGLAPYGKKGSSRVEEYKRAILAELIDLKEDGSLFLNMSYFTFATSLCTVDDAKWIALFGIPPRPPESLITESYMDLALAIQEVTEEVLLRLAKTTRSLTGSSHLVMAGGVALNCVANARLRDAGIFEKIWIQPAAGDAGGALGAALAAEHIYFGEARVTREEGEDGMHGAYLGPAYAEAEIERMARRYSAIYEICGEAAMMREVARRLAEGQVVGWMQGRMEWGPRALGNRSILADPCNTEMQRKLNLKIKFRESFRPFAPIVLEEDASQYFDVREKSPYMLFTAPVVESRRKKGAPADAPLGERLNAPRSDIPAVTHLDYSARLQTVSAKTNPRLAALLLAFKSATGYSVLVNTSFNVRGEPIVMTPEDAYRCFMNTEMDSLVIGDILFDKRKQPAWERTDTYGED